MGVAMEQRVAERRDARVDGVEQQRVGGVLRAEVGDAAALAALVRERHAARDQHLVDHPGRRSSTSLAPIERHGGTKVSRSAYPPSGVRITSAIGSASCSPSASSGNRIWKCRRWTSTGRAPARGVVVGQLGGVRGEARPGSAGRKAVAELRARRRGGRQAERDHDRVLLGVEVSPRPRAAAAADRRRGSRTACRRAARRPRR